MKGLEGFIYGENVLGGGMCDGLGEGCGGWMVGDLMLGGILGCGDGVIAVRMDLSITEDWERGLFALRVAVWKWVGLR